MTPSPGFRPEPKWSWRGFRRKSLLRAVALPVAFFAATASAQVVPSLVLPPHLSVFGTLPTNITPDFAPIDSPVLYGYSLGGFYQSPHIIGVELRGSIQRRGNAQHQESALAGPRAAFQFGRFRPYTSLLFGAGNGWRYKNPPTAGERLPQPVEGRGPQWTLAAGLDLQISHRLAIRVGDVSYSKVYLQHWDLTPLNVTAGVVWRLK